MIKKTARFDRAVLQAKCVIHYQNDIHVIRFHLGRNVASEDDKSAQVSRALGEFVNVRQPPRANVALTNSSAEAPQDLAPRGAIDAGRQIAFSIKFRQWQVTLHAG